MDKRLYRSEKNKIIAGVCGGIGEYFEVDPVFIRIISVLLVMASGFGVLAYIIAWIIMPKKESLDVKEENITISEVKYSSWNKYLPGMILIAIGILFLIRDNWYWFRWDEVWPVFLIVGGLYLIFHRKSRKHVEDVINGEVKSKNNQANTENGGWSS